MLKAHSIEHAAPAAEDRAVHTTCVTLKYLLGLVPIVAGADKFTNLLAHWENYLSPFVTRLIPLSGFALMRAVGVIEIVAGVLVLVKPRIGAYVVMAWLLAISAQLILSGHYLDVAVRDIVIALGGALTLARLSPFTEQTAA
jgi:uncharacterized membrane protein YphA (DoxX/SURF4 family)